MPRPRPVIAATLAAVALLATACLPPPEPPPGWSQVFITRDGADVTKISSSSADAAHVQAPRDNGGKNSRTLFWRNDAPVTRDHTACATTTHSGGQNQDGVALRVGPSPHGGTRGITVNRNIWAGAHWIYNVMLWDTSPGNDHGTGVRTFHQVSAVDQRPAVSKAPSPTAPRRLCARVTGADLEWKVWPTNIDEPAWGDPVHTGSVRLPPAWVYDGSPGLYIGHTPPGGWAAFEAFTVTG